ncbi:MAG: ATP synthase subunit I [Azospira sp.]|jgi:ATP synthase protein I|nr:ATP synthase subunit I [Azospira sp.]
MFRAISLQIGASIVVTALAGLLVGTVGAVSAALGAVASVLPNLLFALRLSIVARRPGANYPVNFFFGEFVKIAATIGILAIAIKGYADLHWPSMLIALVVASQASFLAFWKKT